MPKGRGFTPLSVSVAQAEDGVGVGLRQILRPLIQVHGINSFKARSSGIRPGEEKTFSVHEKRAALPLFSGCPKSLSDFLDSLHNASYFKLPRNLKYCRCAAQTPAGAGFLQAFNLIRGGLRPLELPLLLWKDFPLKKVFRQTETPRSHPGTRCFFFRRKRCMHRMDK